MVAANPHLTAVGAGEASFAIREFDPLISSEWDAFLATQKNATPFHSIAWMRALQRTFDYENRSLYAEQNGRITGVLPLFLVSNWIVGRCLISSPFADYGGVCAEDEKSADALIARAREIGFSERVDFIDLRSKYSKRHPDYYLRDLYVSFEANLSTDPEEQLRSLPRDTRYMIRKSSKSGLEASVGLDQLSDFYKLFAYSWHQLGTPVLSYGWLEALVDEFKPIIDLTLVRLKGEPVAGVLSFVFQDTLYPHYAGNSPLARSVAANNFVYWELLRTGIERGITRFDFGRSKKNTGAYQFKSAWNMEARTLQYQVSMVKGNDRPDFSPANPKFALAAKAWSRLPLALSTWVGPRVVCWFP